MNFGYKKTVDKRKELSSNSRRIKSKAVMSFVKIFMYALLLIVVVGGFTAFGMVKGILETAPVASEIDVSPTAYATKVYDSEGNLVTTISTDGSNRDEVTIENIPESLQYAFIDIEDERFYEHNGIDLQGIIRAGFVTLSGTGFEGASTITQQLIKNNVFESGGFETSLGALFKRKIQEQYLAVELEKIMDKSIILQNYLNTINLGAGNYGVKTAASYYFGKEVSDLTISESAVLAAIAQNPSLNPVSYPEENGERRAKVLSNMLKNGHITQAEYDEAVEDEVYARIQANTAGKSNSPIYSYFTDALVEQILTDLQEEKGYSATQAYNALYRGGLEIYTTQDTQIQNICDEIIADESNYPADKLYYSFDWAWTITLPDDPATPEDEEGTTKNYSKVSIYNYHRNDLGDENFSLNYKTHEEALADIENFKNYILSTVGGETLAETDVTFTIEPQISFSVMDQYTGEVKALVGGRGEKSGSLTLNRATDTMRQPGSTFKVVSTYAPALDSGGYTLGTAIDDAKLVTSGKDWKNWWGDGYRGLNTVRTGIRDSMNILAVKTFLDIGSSLSLDYLEKFGFTTLVTTGNENDYNASTALGGITNGVKNIELCASYATIANSGTYTEPILYTKIVDKSGRVILENEPETETVLKDSTAWLLTSAMIDVVNSGTGTPARVNGVTVAGKTGTTSNTYDLWFVGYTGYLTACIWTGYDNNMSIGSEGVSYHKQMWSKIVSNIYATKGWGDKSIMSMPAGITTAQICSKSGKLAIAGVCDSDLGGTTVVTEYFAEGTAPTESCDAHIKLTVCSETGQLESSYCPTTIGQVFRVRPEGSEGTTADTPFTVPEGFLDIICTLHSSGVDDEETSSSEE